MILSALRKQLRGWLQDTTTGGVQWTDQQLDRYINLALRETETFILGFDPEAFKCIYTAHTTVPASTGLDNIYSWPAGTLAVHEVALSADGINYVPLPMLPLKVIRDMRRGNTASMAGFVPQASHWILWPSPTAVTTNGLRVIVAPTLVMADDNDKSPLPHAYETMNLKQAQLFALWDVGEPTETVKKEIEALGGKASRVDTTARGTEPPIFMPTITRY